MPYDPQTQAAMDMVYTSSKGITSKLGDLPLRYLRNIEAKLARDEQDPELLDAVMLVVATKAAEAEEAEATAMQNRGEQ